MKESASNSFIFADAISEHQTAAIDMFYKINAIELFCHSKCHYVEDW